MKPKKRQKLCYNCEGEVDLDVIVCPFCAADLREEKPEQNKYSYNSAFSVKNLETQESLYTQPRPTLKMPSPPEVPIDEVDEEPEALEVEEGDSPRSIIGPTLLFTLGVQLFLFGLMMFFFQKEGAMILKWDARMWFLYIFASIPFLIFGYRAISKL
jgi:hypothetical protein